MTTLARPWDYLIVTASNDRQAAAYEAQLKLRLRLNMLSMVRDVLVVPDPQGRRVGSGGSTVSCLLAVLNRELAGPGAATPEDPEAWRQALAGKRILIVHAGGDSKRLPAYGPCGKVFIPLPGPTDAAVSKTLFDRQMPVYLDLPEMPPGAGQVVIVAGDDIKLFDARAVAWAPEGFTGLASYASPEVVARHGGFCLGEGRRVRRYFQKASPRRQRELDAVDSFGRSLLDVAVFNFDAPAAVALLRMCEVRGGPDGRLTWSDSVGAGVLEHGLDFFSDVCCALGAETTCEDYVAGVRAVGGAWSDAQLRTMFDVLNPLPLSTQALEECAFLHFGRTVQLIASGEDILRRDGVARPGEPLSVNNDAAPAGRLVGAGAWVEGCRVGAEVRLEGENVVTGVDADAPMSLRRGMCLDVLKGATRQGDEAWFVRCYGSRDAFKDSLADGATFCNVPVVEWLESAGACPADVWPDDAPGDQQTLWTARIVPAAGAPGGYKDWLWMFDPSGATAEQKLAWKSADRYSLSEIALLADQDAFHSRRARIVAADRARHLRSLLAPRSRFSAWDLAEMLRCAADPGAIAAELLGELHRHDRLAAGAAGDFSFSRICHSLGTAVAELAGDQDRPLEALLPGLGERAGGMAIPGGDGHGGAGQTPMATRKRVAMPPSAEAQSALTSARAAQAEAFRYLGEAILSHGEPMDRPPRSALRENQIVWGRAPVRLELGGGWTDTPPYTLEFGGAVLNAAVNLNGQPPAQVFLRVIAEPVIRIHSLDVASRVEIRELDELLDYRRPGNEFALSMAALALAGFSPELAPWPDGVDLGRMLERFGGGIELTTLAAVPKGSGLGTSSVLGAVILAVIHRAMGGDLSRADIFHKVLQLEQALTTGGGWQDQIGGQVDGTKITKTLPGPVPKPDVHMVPSDVLDPKWNGGASLLYYTGLTRLAKNILERIVGRYLDRDRAAMEALDQEYLLAHTMAEAMSRRDAARFGELIDVAWGLQQKLCAEVTNEPIEELLSRVRPRIHGARILGAGSGGFLLMICKSPRDAAAIRADLEARPLNDQARFFDFDINREGLVVGTY